MDYVLDKFYEGNDYSKDDESYDPNKDPAMKSALSNAVSEFLCAELMMDTAVVESLNIKDIFLPRNPNGVVYIRLPGIAKVNLIYSHAKHMNNNSMFGRPELVKYIPPQLYPRYAALEREARDIRYRNPPMSTNIRIGDSDLVLKVKPKGDVTPWRDVEDSELPGDLPPIVTSNTSSQSQPHNTKTKATGRVKHIPTILLDSPFKHNSQSGHQTHPPKTAEQTSAKQLAQKFDFMGQAQSPSPSISKDSLRSSKSNTSHKHNSPTPTTQPQNA